MKSLIVLLALAITSLASSLEPIDNYSNPYNRLEQSNRNDDRAFKRLDIDGDKANYQGSSGAKYQYDLSKQSDQLRYDVDPSAQLRDEMNDYRNDISMDRLKGEHGGGYLPE